MQLTRNFREMLITHVGLYFDDSSAQGHIKIASVESCFTADLEVSVFSTAITSLVSCKIW